MTRTLPKLLIAAGLVATAGAGLFLAQAPRPVAADTVIANRGPAQRVLSINGRVRPRLEVEIRAPLAGRLVQLPFDVGDHIAKGDIVAATDDAPERAAIAQAEAAVTAQAVTVAQARRELARYEALGDFAAKQDVERRRLAVHEGERELQRRRAASIQAIELRERRILRAPFDGVVLDRPVDPGQMVGPDSIIARLADLESPEVTAEVDEIYAAEIRVGAPALVSLPGYREPVEADVLHVEPRVDPATGAREVRLAVRGPGLEAPSGLTVTVNIIVEIRADAISIPRSAILQEGAIPRVFVVDALGVVHERSIAFIDWPADRVIITSGLKDGERVLSAPRADMAGQKVRVAP